LTAQAVWYKTGTGLRQLVIKKNGAFFIGGGVDNRLANDVTTTDQQTRTAVVDVNAGDYFEVEAYQSSGAAIPVLTSTGTWFELEVVE
jgi:hypothetical protein